MIRNVNQHKTPGAKTAPSPLRGEGRVRGVANEGLRPTTLTPTLSLKGRGSESR